jgi:predicted dithiol-disulfide oxidoreductase (DUF899 family)
MKSKNLVTVQRRIPWRTVCHRYMFMKDAWESDIRDNDGEYNLIIFLFLFFAFIVPALEMDFSLLLYSTGRYSFFYF